MKVLNCDEYVQNCNFFDVFSHVSRHSSMSFEDTQFLRQDFLERRFLASLMKFLKRDCFNIKFTASQSNFSVYRYFTYFSRFSRARSRYLELVPQILKRVLKSADSRDSRTVLRFSLSLFNQFL